MSEQTTWHDEKFKALAADPKYQKFTADWEAARNYAWEQVNLKWGAREQKEFRGPYGIGPDENKEDPTTWPPPESLDELQHRLTLLINQCEGTAKLFNQHGYIQTSLPKWGRKTRDFTMMVDRQFFANGVDTSKVLNDLSAKSDKLTFDGQRDVYIELRRLVREAIKNPPSKDRIPLGGNAGLLFEKLITLPEHKGMTGRQITDWLQNDHDTIIDESRVAKELVPALKPYGIKNTPRIGYYIPLSKRPKNP